MTRILICLDISQDTVQRPGAMMLNIPQGHMGIVSKRPLNAEKCGK